ncbi:MAG TPA: hypothetical protein VJM50_14115 [Pyrinomonadaceae bacterium]|nr:hypothetical protein [Pyrinomonadaceae bacterium]
MIRILTVIAFVIAAANVLSAQSVCNRFQAGRDRCDLNGMAVEQAKCLLRPVKKFAHLGDPLGELPAPLETLIGQPTSVTQEQLKRFLDAKGIREADVGGALSISLTKPKYFVIHDTSDLLTSSEFPATINDATSSLNNLSRRVARKVCHVYIDRTGQSATAVNFESRTPPSGTKFGSCHRSQRTAFLHIENIQPRIRDRSVKFPNDALAPEPGFSEAQLERLALVYVVASVRSGKWLIPAYHSPIDLGYPDRHDDPQNFDVQTWAVKLRELIEEIGN